MSPLAIPVRNQAGGQAAGVGLQLPVRPLATVARRRVPHEHRVVRPVLGPVVEEPGDVLAVHLELLEGGGVHRQSMSDPAVAG